MIIELSKKQVKGLLDIVAAAKGEGFSLDYDSILNKIFKEHPELEEYYKKSIGP